MVCGKNMAQLQALMVNGGSNPVEICRSSGARRRYQTICAPVSDFRPRTRPDDWNNFLLISLFVPYFPLDFGSNSSFTKCPHSFCLTIINLEKNLWQSIKDIKTKTFPVHSSLHNVSHNDNVHIQNWMLGFTHSCPYEVVGCHLSLCVCVYESVVVSKQRVACVCGSNRRHEPFSPDVGRRILRGAER